MPLLLIFGARGTPEGSFRFDTVVKLSPRRVPVAFRSYVRPVERVPVTFASLIRLRSNRLPVAFRTYVALRPAQALGPALPPGTPVQVVPGGLPVRWRLSCPLGHAVQGSYQHDGDSETATHALSLVFSLLAAPAAPWAGRSPYGPKTGWFAAASARRSQ